MKKIEQMRLEIQVEDTEQRQAEFEEALRDLKSRYRQLVREMTEGGNTKMK